MITSRKIILINTERGAVEVTLYGESVSEDTVFEISHAEAIENGEAPFQIKEGCTYEYMVSSGFYLEPSEVVSQSKFNSSMGRISPNIYVGTLTINIFKCYEKVKCGELKLEVRSVKASYRQDYRHMLEEITEKCTELLMQHSSPVSQFFEIDPTGDANTLYQRFAFIKSILESEDFSNSVQKILTAPVTKWKESETIKDIRGVRRLHNSAIRQIVGASNRIDLPDGHPLRSVIHSVPSKIKINYKTETVDTPENRFVKYALATFLSFLGEIRTALNNNNRLKSEVAVLEDKLEQMLSHSIFKEISPLTTLSLNSPVLQRKEGYREVLKVWLMFDLAARLVWHGGDDVYGAGKRDIAVLYEYWLFFKLLDLMREVFRIETPSIDELIEPTNDGLCLKLKQGKSLLIKGVFQTETRKLNVQFAYNRTFSGNQNYPLGGSWTRDLRPDYTLTIWPAEISQEQAENEELIVHIHFDAKYKVERMEEIYEIDRAKTTPEKIDIELGNEKIEQKRGTYKSADILKMHTYRYAIRRTAGAYVLYPGTESVRREGFHEILPGLGAFSIRPSHTNNGIEKLRRFLLDVVTHFMNRASQREKMALRIYQTHLTKANTILNEALPEAYGLNRNFLPDETFILIGYSNSQERFLWYEENRKYVFRMDEAKGSLELTIEVVNAKYLLIRRKGRDDASDLFKIISKGPKVYSSHQLHQLHYPLSARPKDHYLVIEIERVKDKEFENLNWKFKELKEYKHVFETEVAATVELDCLSQRH